mmetsp:Transcript_15475/g.50888  ORF Transcript_15475/g.50888 Transcript_15475/m.50888 type:complete len:434 (-) Transcript_15475:15-1316(-)
MSGDEVWRVQRARSAGPSSAQERVWTPAKSSKRGSPGRGGGVARAAALPRRAATPLGNARSGSSSEELSHRPPRASDFQGLDSAVSAVAASAADAAAAAMWGPSLGSQLSLRVFSPADRHDLGVLRRRMVAQLHAALRAGAPEEAVVDTMWRQCTHELMKRMAVTQKLRTAGGAPPRSHHSSAATTHHQYERAPSPLEAFYASAPSLASTASSPASHQHHQQQRVPPLQLPRSGTLEAPPAEAAADQTTNHVEQRASLLRALEAEKLARAQAERTLERLCMQERVEVAEAALEAERRRWFEHEARAKRAQEERRELTAKIHDLERREHAERAMHEELGEEIARRELAAAKLEEDSRGMAEDARRLARAAEELETTLRERQERFVALTDKLGEKEHALEEVEWNLGALEKRIADAERKLKESRDRLQQSSGTVA